MPPGGDADDAKGWCFPGSAGWGWVLHLSLTAKQRD